MSKDHSRSKTGVGSGERQYRQTAAAAVLACHFSPIDQCAVQHYQPYVSGQPPGAKPFGPLCPGGLHADFDFDHRFQLPGGDGRCAAGLRPYGQGGLCRCGTDPRQLFYHPPADLRHHHPWCYSCLWPPFCRMFGASGETHALCHELPGGSTSLGTVFMQD